MNRLELELLSSLEELCNLYEMYIWKRANSNLELLLQDNSISFYLYEDNEVIDEVIFTFGDNVREMKVYRYISIRVILMLLGNVMMFIDNNILYNNTHKPYFKVIINDDSLLEVIKVIVDRQYNEVINENIDIIRSMYTSIPYSFKHNKFKEKLHNRIDVSRKLLRYRERLG